MTVRETVQTAEFNRLMLQTKGADSVFSSVASMPCLWRIEMQVSRFWFISVETGTLQINSLFVWLVVDGWCWFVLREKYSWWLLVAGLFRDKSTIGWWLISQTSKA
jgi:hypothetical protein